MSGIHVEIIKAPVQNTGEKGLHEHGIVATLCDDSHFHLVFDQRLDVDIQPEQEDFSLMIDGQAVELGRLNLTSGTRGEVGWSLISFDLNTPIKPGTPVRLRYHPRQYFLWSEERDAPIEGFELHTTVADVNILKALELGGNPRNNKRAPEKEAPPVKIKANAHIVEACDRQVRIALKHLLETSADPKAEDFRVESTGYSLHIDRVYLTRVSNGAELSLLLRENVEPNKRIKVSYKPGRRPLRTPTGQQLQSFDIDGFGSAHPLDLADMSESTGASFDDIDQLLDQAKHETTRDGNNVVSLFDKSKEQISETPKKEVLTESEPAPVVKQKQEQEKTPEAEQTEVQTQPEQTPAPAADLLSEIENESAAEAVEANAEEKTEVKTEAKTETPAVPRKITKVETAERATAQQIVINSASEEQGSEQADNQDTSEAPQRPKLHIRMFNEVIANPFALLAAVMGIVVIGWAFTAAVNFVVVFLDFDAYTKPEAVVAQQNHNANVQAAQRVNSPPANDARESCSITANDGSSFNGSCLNGIRDGGGNNTYPNGDVYSGEWANDMRHGNGMLKKANGEIYAGNFRNDKITGRGSYTWTDGKAYEGEVVDGQLHGQGKLVYPNGSVFEGRFENGNIVEGTCTTPDGIKFTGPCKIPD